MRFLSARTDSSGDTCRLNEIPFSCLTVTVIVSEVCSWVNDTTNLEEERAARDRQWFQGFELVVVRWVCSQRFDVQHIGETFWSMSRVHILGAGAVGLLHAHHLSKIPNLSVCLLRRHSPNTRTQTIQVANIDGSLATTTLSVASAKNLQEPISHLLVTTKSYDAVEALESVRPHLSKTPIIMLLTNGVLGVYDELTSNPPFEGAKFMLGYTTHGCIKTTETSVTHTGQGRHTI